MADACLQTSMKSHGNGRRFTVNYLPLTQLPEVVPSAYYSFLDHEKKEKINISLYKGGHSAYHSMSIAIHIGNIRDITLYGTADSLCRPVGPILGVHDSLNIGSEDKSQRWADHP